MSESVLSQIEDGFNQLSISEQLRLIERLRQRVHAASLKDESELEKQLALMADDPEIRNELHNIEREFANVEADGLELD